MKFKVGLTWCIVLFGAVIILPEIILGKTVVELFPRSRSLSKRSAPRSSSTISETSQQSGSASGHVVSSSEGNGEPGSATAYAWQGGQTSAQGTQTATADQNSNLNSQTSGSSTCQQGYNGNASGNQANSVGSALCNATNTQSGTHETTQDTKENDERRGKFPPFQFGNLNFPTPIQMNATVAQIGEAQSGQTHNSISNVGGETGGLMNIFAGGFAGTPQGSMTFSHSAFDPQGNVLNANQSLLTAPGLNSEEHTMVDLGGTDMGHNSGGLAHVYGLGNIVNSTYNSHAVEDEKNPGWKRP